MSTSYPLADFQRRGGGRSEVQALAGRRIYRLAQLIITNDVAIADMWARSHVGHVMNLTLTSEPTRSDELRPAML